MKIFPAIDIKDKKCVRLIKGDFDNKTEYATSPIDQAGKYKDHGFKNLHIVDLDGALTGETVKATGEKISRVEDKIDKILAMESSQVASALEEQGSSIRAVIDEVEERKGELNEKFSGKLKELESLVIPMLKGLMKNAEKEYIYWPDRTPILEKQIAKVYSITRPE